MDGARGAGRRAGSGAGREGAQELELRQLRCLVAIADTGTFTDAAIELGVSQAAVSRTLRSLEELLGVRLLHRTSRTTEPTAAGMRVLARARQLLADAEDLAAEAVTGRTRLRVGHAWSAMGKHTQRFQRRWAQEHPGVELRLIRTNTPTGGLAEGACDLAVVRAGYDERRFDGAVVGRERRHCALAADDPLASRRTLRLEEVSGHTLLVDRRTGTATATLWPPESRPEVEHVQDVDDWLAAIASGGSMGITPEATAAQYRRQGIVFRPLRDAPLIEVRLIWPRHDPHPATRDAVDLLTELYGERRGR
ncbi:LysR family transcriptional regulator [Streptomyces sp. ODS28]|uniref:LysR family transcriptional regulator n=1 Tax=Streptomyces sp. ODS28 TaxID=3136688 RepID=UPI0031EEE78D